MEVAAAKIEGNPMEAAAAKIEGNPMEVAAAEKDGKKYPAAALPPTVAITMCLLSLLFGWLTARALRRCDAGDVEKEFMSAALWSLSPLFSSYLFLWSVALSEARGAVPKLKGVSFMLLLAAAAAKIVRDRAGAAAMFLATVYSAMACGRALADRRQRAGTERSADAAALSTPRYQSRTEDRHDRACRTVFVCIAVVVVAVLTLVMWFMLWVAPPGPETDGSPGEVALAVLVGLAAPGLLAARMILLYGGTFDSGMGEEPWEAMVLGFIGWIVGAVFVGLLFSPSYAVAFFLLPPLCTAGLLGYSQAVRARYTQLVATKRNQPRTAQDASGLLAGRDKEDVCFVHI